MLLRFRDNVKGRLLPSFLLMGNFDSGGFKVEIISINQKFECNTYSVKELQSCVI